MYSESGIVGSIPLEGELFFIFIFIYLEADSQPREPPRPYLYMSALTMSLYATMYNEVVEAPWRHLELFPIA